METADWFNFRNLAWSGEFPAGNFPASGRRMRESSRQCHTPGSAMSLSAFRDTQAQQRQCAPRGRKSLFSLFPPLLYIPPPGHLRLHPHPCARTYTHRHMCRFNPTITSSKEQGWEPWLQISLGSGQFF